jgi:hypothetical protein
MQVGSKEYFLLPQPHADEIAGQQNPTILWQLHYTSLKQQ